MKKYDYLVVGSGLYGAIFAHEAKANGKSVLVVDKRPNIAGNVYTEKQEGINVHMYGAHIFHTNNKKVCHQVSIDHYAPWVHKYHMDVIFCVRILYIVDSINKIIDHIDDFDLSPLAREWFAGFGKIGGDVIHLVIGLLIGFDNAVSLKECLLLDEANRIVDNYEWMNFPEFGLEIDVQNTDVIFFHPGQHPLENEKIKKCIFETVIELDKFSVEQQSALQEVCKIITENMVSESPTIDELKAAFNSVMLPKTII